MLPELSIERYERLIHVNMDKIKEGRQKPLQYCKVISLQLIKKEKKKKKKEGSRGVFEQRMHIEITGISAKAGYVDESKYFSVSKTGQT